MAGAAGEELALALGEGLVEDEPDRVAVGLPVGGVGGLEHPAMTNRLATAGTAIAANSRVLRLCLEALANDLTL